MRWRDDGRQGLMKAFALDTALLEGVYESVVGDMATSHVAELPNREACIIKLLRLSCCQTVTFLPKACKSILVRVLCSFCLRHFCMAVCAMTAKALGQGKQECLYLGGGLEVRQNLLQCLDIRECTIMNSCGWLLCKQF